MTDSKAESGVRCASFGYQNIARREIQAGDGSIAGVHISRIP